MKAKIFPILLILLLSSNIAFSASEVEERNITGYYYDPNRGNILPKYDDLTPRQVEAYVYIKDNPNYVSEISEMNYRDFKKLSPGFAMYVPPEKFSSLSNNQFKKLSDEWRSNMTIDQVQSLNTSRVKISNLSEDQRLSLTEEQIQNITNRGEYRYIPSELIHELTNDQVSSMNDNHFKKLSEDQKLNMTDEQFQSVDTSNVRISRIPEEKREALTQDQVQDITRQGQYRYLPESKIPDLTTDQVSSINDKNFKKLSSDQKLNMTDEQIQSIDTSNVRVARIPEEKRETLTQDQVQSITRQDQYRRLPSSKIPDLTTDQVSSINKKNFKKFSDEQIHTMTEDQVNSIPDTYYDSIKNRLTDEQRLWRP